MSNNHIAVPVLDAAVLQEKATEYAMKGAVETIKEFYTGYNSPWKKQIEASLSKTETSVHLDLPDILALINESLTAEITKIANTAVSKTFVPLVNKFLSREEKEIKFSDILKEFIKAYDTDEPDDFSIDINKREQYGWLDITLQSADSSYSFTLHEDYNSKKEEKEKYWLGSIPEKDSKEKRYQTTMKLRIEGGELEMPFVRDVLSDNFQSYMARLVIGHCLITMDCRDFNEDWFENDNCHCH